MTKIKVLDVQTYVRPSELAKILGWRRTTVYYWLHKLEDQIPIVMISGLHFIPAKDLARVVLMLDQAKREATKGRPRSEAL